jgi:4-amino-4-deoxy-L-arabinose transferase-like glycosyltransferase
LSEIAAEMGQGGALDRLRPVGLGWLLIVAAIGLWRLAPGLAHPSIASWDESAHQAVTRGLLDTGEPVIYADPLVPILPSDWLNAGVFLHKPVLPFFLGAQVMRLTGVTPLALRLVSLVAAILTAWILLLLARPTLGRLGGLLVAAVFLTLPFHWRLVQGYQFGDVTDTTLLLFLSLAFFWQLRALEERRLALAAWAGAALGLGFLCKTALVLAPLGAAAVLVAVPLGGTTAAFRLRVLLVMAVAAFLVGAPWNIYAAWRWPVLYRFEWAHTFGHLSGETVTNWVKPFDALWNEINELELEPLSPALVALSGLFLLGRGVIHRREPRAVLLALWLLIEWAVLSAAKAKVPAIAWGAVPPLLIGLGDWTKAAATHPTLAGALIGAGSAPWLASRLPMLARWRAILPNVLVQTRQRPGLLEGLVLAAVFAGAAFLLSRPKVGRRVLTPALGIGAVLLAFYLGLVVNARTLQQKVAALRDQSLESYTDALGPAIDQAVLKKSVLLLAPDRNRPCCFEKQNLMFYSGRMVYPRSFEQRARDRGYHPYLIASSAQPYAEVPTIPAGSPLRAFDLDVPLPGPSPIPDGLHEASGDATGVTMLGYGVLAGDAERDRYAIFLKSNQAQARVEVSFDTPSGKQDRTLSSDLSLEGVMQLNGAAWYILPVLGPKQGTIKGITLRP